MKLEDLLRMAFNDGKRYGQGNTNLNFKQHFESKEYIEAIKLVKNCSIPLVSECVTWTTDEVLNIIEENEHLDDLRMFFTEHGR